MSIEIKKLRTNFEVRFNFIKPYFHFNKSLSEFIKSLPKDQQQTKMDSVRKEDGTIFNDWYRVVNEAALAKIIDFIKSNNLKFKFTNMEPEDVEKLKKEFELRLKTKKEALQAKYETIDTSVIDWGFMKIEPYEYQKQAAIFCDKSRGLAIIGDEPGTGKSLESILYGIMTKKDKKILAIMPASLKLNFRNEVLKFSNEKAFVYKWKPRRKSNEVVYTKEESLFHIINYESLESFIRYNFSHKCTTPKCGFIEINDRKKYKECPNCKRQKSIKTKADALEFIKKDDVELRVEDYDLIIFDEAHYLKNMDSARSKISRKAFKSIKRKILMSGTAILNRSYELFPLLNMIAPDEFKNQHHFGVRYCNGHENEYGYWDFSGNSNLEELSERISPYFIRRKKEDILKHLPPKTFTDIPIELSLEQWREYKKAEKGVVDEITEVETELGYLAKAQKLKQITCSIKTKQAIEIIENYIENGEKIVVFAEFLKNIDELHQYFGNKSVVFTGKKSMDEKNEAVQKFMDKDSEVMVFLGSLGAASVGITLTIANTAIVISQSFSPSINTQAHDRIHRATTIGNVQIITLYCCETIDEDIMNLLKEKEKVISKVLDGEETFTQSNKVESTVFKDLIKIFLNKKS